MSLQESTTSKFARWVFAKTLLLTGEIEMKKTLAAVAVLGAFAGSALAADVQLYGLVDTGVVYQHMSSYDVLGQNVDSEDSFGMNSGVAAGSRWGFKGTEDLGNGLTVGFVLENGFSSDTGAWDRVTESSAEKLSSSFVLASANSPWGASATSTAETVPMASLVLSLRSVQRGVNIPQLPTT